MQGGAGGGQGSTGGASGAPPRSWLLPPIQRQGVTLPLNGGIVPRSVLTLGAQVGSEEPPRDPITRSMDLKDRLPPDLHWRTFLCFSGLLWFQGRHCLFNK